MSLNWQKENTGGVRFFLGLFLLWVILGGLLCFCYDKTILFQSINTRHNPFLDVFFKYYTYVGTAIVILPVLLLLLIFRYHYSKKVLGLFVCCQIPSLLINQAMKFFFDKKRPVFFYKDQDWFHTLEGVKLHAERSFPSGHTAGAFAFFLLLSILLNDRNKYFAFIFFIMALLVGYSRVYLAQHFYEDIYAGSIEGILTCWILYMLYQKWLSKSRFKTQH